MVICLKQGVGYLHIVPLMPLHCKTFVVSCFIKIENGFMFTGTSLPRLFRLLTGVFPHELAMLLPPTSVVKYFLNYDVWW